MFGRREIIYVPDARPAPGWAKVAWLVAGLLIVAAILAQSDDTQPRPEATPGAASSATAPVDRGPSSASAANPVPGPSEPTPITTPSDDQKDLGELYSVVSVTDGDTFRATYRGTDEPVRLIGVDAPETVHPDEAQQCFGQESSDYLRQMLTGNKVFLVRDGGQDDRDQYGRLLRFAYLEDRSNVNVALVRGGYATYEEQYPIAEPFRSELARAESSAIRRNAGLWEQCW